MADENSVSRETPPPPAVAVGVFGVRLPIAVQFADLLAEQGTVRGLIGPREVPRLWDRHLLNCAVLADVIPGAAGTLADVGSGAGLPGLVLAIRRPDLAITLIEPLQRRTSFLTEAIETLGLDNVDVLRGRAEELTGRKRRDAPTFDVVTARAVAPMERLAGWCLPLVRPGGVLLAMKGATAGSELPAARRTIGRLGGTDVEVLTTGAEVLESPTTVVRVRRKRA